ncbi:hypothetical protein HU675_0045245 [Bradyrhizobium septentrionale]|uniref:hypothetical protein n=1 Tax=Bradyrhizobium septentrionale TaxID=1404411 RepID=UPI001596CD33|nr:hypothetical protein [Bradyrhizobium septentrionale]UGY21515.1 hypothetical protein HU675_0026165 [Bradyrhizobium septentrionale]UGY24707.1 hypothetical protein HU675_0043585 [Bradyrhizobium septentrionale]UGY24999.1 hypothetical protein HU675_0045245 [Bradyrhizobium septentrionale]
MRVMSKVALCGKRQNERVQMIAETVAPGIRVSPAKEEYRAVLKHPKGGGFPAEGGKVWPNDRFTKRRLAEGSITRDEPAEQEQSKPQERRRPQHGARPEGGNDAA